MAGGDRERDVEEETRNQMMQNIFGDQSEDEDDADDDDIEVVDEDHRHQLQQPPPQRHQELDDDVNEDEEEDARSHAHARSGGYHSEEVDGEAENGGEGEGESEGQVGMEEESEGEAHRADLDQGEIDGDKVQISPERELDDQRVEPDARGMDSEDEGYQHRTVSSRRRGVVASESEGSADNYYADGGQEDEEAHRTRKPSSPMEEERDQEVVRDVVGDSDEDEPAPYRAHHEIDEDSHRSPMEDEGQYENDMQPDDVVADEDMQYESDENCELKPKEKPVGPPLNLVVPFRQPPARPNKMNVIKVSNIMGIDPKPFDPKTYVEEDVFVIDESGTKKRIRLEDNIVRWRNVRNADGTTSGILQSQGRLLHKMRFMPSSLSRPLVKEWEAALEKVENDLQLRRQNLNTDAAALEGRKKRLMEDEAALAALEGRKKRLMEDEAALVERTSEMERALAAREEKVTAQEKSLLKNAWDTRLLKKEMDRTRAALKLKEQQLAAREKALMEREGAAQEAENATALAEKVKTLERNAAEAITLWAQETKLAWESLVQMKSALQALGLGDIELIASARNSFGAACYGFAQVAGKLSGAWELMDAVLAKEGRDMAHKGAMGALSILKSWLPELDVNLVLKGVNPDTESWAEEECQAAARKIALEWIQEPEARAFPSGAPEDKEEVDLDEDDE